MEITVAIILYADDAALPADSIEDLQISAAIFEQFCKDMRLTIAVPKTFLMVFHCSDDTNVHYGNNSDVYVQGARCKITNYDQIVSATSSFKYLGVTLDATCSPSAHIKARVERFHNATGSFFAGLVRILSSSFDFTRYLWNALVLPVCLYGVEVFSWSDRDLVGIQSWQNKSWRHLVQVGG
eukprot:3000930-Karenia_brevis.AAC.1